MIRDKQERLIILVIFILLTGFAMQFGPIPTEARIYPLILLILCACIASIIFFYPTKQMQSKKTETIKNPENTHISNNVYKDKRKIKLNYIFRAIGASQHIKILIFCLLVFIYILSIRKISYVLATLLFIFVSLLIQGIHNKIVLVLLPILITLVVYMFFSKVLYVILPQGQWINIYF